MKNYSHKEIVHLIERFEKQCLPKVEWTHEAHLVVAVWYCDRHPLNEAMTVVREKITLHNESVGTPNSDTEGYHESITRFWLWVAAEFLKGHANEDLATKCNLLIQSERGKSNYPLTYYSTEKLFSVRARKEWVEPDLVPLV